MVDLALMEIVVVVAAEPVEVATELAALPQVQARALLVVMLETT